MSSIRIRIANLLLSVQSPSALQRIESFVHRELEQQNRTSPPTFVRKSASTEVDFGTGAPVATPELKPKSKIKDWELAIEQCDSILDSLEELPERAADFQESVEDKVAGIREWIEKNKDVTAAQLTALQNMEDGVSRWQR
jgi:hypothetical protein